MGQLRTSGIDFKKKYICMECGAQRAPVKVNRGLWVVELLLWLCYLVPGLIYSLWRRLRKVDVCPVCGQPSVMLTSSRRAAQVRVLMKTLSSKR